MLSLDENGASGSCGARRVEASHDTCAKDLPEPETMKAAPALKAPFSSNPRGGEVGRGGIQPKGRGGLGLDEVALLGALWLNEPRGHTKHS